jgi:uncharacterized protein (DUF952 family)
VTTLYRILPAGEWRAAQAAGVFAGTLHDQRDGYIHFSASHQVVETAARHYAGATDLVLLSISSDALAQLRPDALKWEISRGGARFPHLYASLPVEAVRRVEELPLGSDGRHVFPELES